MIGQYLAITKIGNSILLGALLGCLLATETTGQNPAHSLQQYPLDAKEARAMAAQLEHRKMNAFEAVSDFENSLYKLNVSDCERRLDQTPELWSNGTRISTCKDLIEERSRAGDVARQKVKLRNRVIELTNPGARVTVDVLPISQRHTILLKERHEHWLITGFTSAPYK
jgi:hypothetical protein